MPAHHSVGSSSFKITPNSSILSSSPLTFVIKGIGTFSGVDRANGFASRFREIEYSHFV